MTNKDKFHKGAIVSLAVLWVLTFALYAVNAFESAEFKLYDVLYQRVSPVDTRIVVIGIDDESIARLGQWPWPRGVMADVIDTLAEGGAAAVGIDILYDTPDRDTSQDIRLAETLDSTDIVTLASQGLFMRKTVEVTDGHINADELITPIEAFHNAKTAHVNAFADSDGIVRRAYLNIAHGDELYPSLAYSLYETYLQHIGNTGSGAASAEAAMTHNSAAPANVPTDAAGRYYISYTGRSGWYHPISFADVYDGNVPPGYFKDKIVLIGLYAGGIARDWHFTSIDSEHATYGIEIHANMLQQFLEDRYLRDISSIADAALFIVFTLIAAVLFIRLRPNFGLLALALLLSAYAAAVYLLVSTGTVAQIVYAPIFCVLAYFTALIWHYARTRAGEAHIRDTFGKYMAPDVVKKVLDEGEDSLVLGGQRRGVTVLFVDIRGFTPLSESAEPEKIVQILNEYLDLAASCIHRYGGTLDKFIGDAAMAFWNAPYDVDSHALAAVSAALDMQRESAQLERELLEKHGRCVSFGIGINSGDAIIGNIGASFRMDYTAIGDTVNTAARLESSAGPGQILLSRATAELLDDNGITLKPLGGLKVKGKSEEIEVFEVHEYGTG